jgi:hypothetical protein
MYALKSDTFFVHHKEGASVHACRHTQKAEDVAHCHLGSWGFGENLGHSITQP